MHQKSGVWRAATGFGQPPSHLGVCSSYQVTGMDETCLLLIDTQYRKMIGLQAKLVSVLSIIHEARRSSSSSSSHESGVIYSSNRKCCTLS